MSRELKFRVWDKNTKKLLFFNDIFNKRPYTETSKLPQYESFPKIHDIDVMQFTGLKDKNGVEIYENDLIQLFEEGELYEVVWKKSGYVLQEINTNNTREWFEDTHRKIVGNKM